MRLQSVQERQGSVLLLIGMHLWPLLGLMTGLLLPLMIAIPITWACLKDRSPLLDDQGRELMNSMLTLILLLLIPIVGWLALVVWMPVWLINCVLGAVAMGKREYFRYPMTLRLIS